ncbi:LacI family DNA-binding transcriptional regulator [Nesterenkonia lutea]|uniref:DNA-binding LacI/PurR family transcriptional regulator n=1 Tax=Nesterenkonia lutea TaxID=272919 RepID=A0ABR9JBP4_9MICC|nr:LacI family DNA-binding transcriptional regulator [Nesterenkonia lutea]MBE1523358.1 DNA-binding LacI/PurR family transcriptional regulator [Nesterenkonia lutea]
MPPLNTPQVGRRVSMADVAAHAGVSSQTVSRVSNDASNVSGPTRDKVLQSMRDLGYRPNSAARALKRGHFRTLGIIAFTMTTYGNVRTIDAIAQAAADVGYATTLLPVRTPTQRSVHRAFGRLEELAADAVIVIMETNLRDSDHLVLPPGVPVVIVDADHGAGTYGIDADQVAGARKATEHLLGLGHNTVWHIAGPLVSHAARRREEAWRASLELAGRTVPPVVRGDWTARSGYEAGLRLPADTECTAVFCANDQMALGLYRALRQAGRRVPEDVSVVGFDNIGDADAFDPPLTTIDQDFEELGRECVEEVMEQLRDPATPSRRPVVRTRLVVRESTAAPV